MGMEMDTNMMGWCECDYRNDRVYYDLLGISYPVPEKVVTTTSANCSSSSSDVGAWGLRSHYDELEGRAVGLCTESLGSESMFDDSSASEEDVDDVNKRIVEEEEKNKPKGWRPRRGEEEIGKPRQFPPPLPSLLQGGSTPRSCSFMKAVRKDRRLVLTEFTIQRPEILRAKREDGRLQLRLVTWPEEEISGAQEAEGQDVEKEEEEVRPEDGDDYGDEEEEEVDDRWRWAAEEDDSLLMMRFGDQMSYGRNDMNKIEEFWRNNPRYVTTA